MTSSDIVIGFYIAIALIALLTAITGYRHVKKLRKQDDEEE
jgi:hypothetical protein